MTSAAASRYARALVDVVLEPRSALQPDVAVAQLREIEQMFAQSAELRNAMATPSIQPSQKRGSVGKILDEISVSPLIRNFIFVVVDHKRAALLPEIRESFETLIDQRMGFVQANVTSAAPLNPRQNSELESELSRVAGKQVILKFSVDPSLLGGVVARIGSTVYDGSIRGQLQQMRRELM